MKIQPLIHKFSIDNNNFEVQVEKIGFHSISFSINRTTINSETTNLFKLYKIVEDIIINQMISDKRIQTIYLLFAENGIVDMIRWMKCCKYYIEKNFKDKLSVESNRMILIVRKSTQFL